eukprot:CAMPEP_0170548668 /NCGR_PEP_ID=MMETSP0211-20121228/6911_1 /TAXON_ID=311385 /ORGANISM="Pseudokeronopsis sp., Strain OXSARD2" /LENGTH=55 /DNA_ID=CAMNT_0010854287 /DNA_START=837 /DNA_END=1004 /DNA_ORIENTATION=+
MTIFNYESPKQLRGMGRTEEFHTLMSKIYDDSVLEASIARIQVAPTLGPSKSSLS